jgi:hypothetical protein
LEGSERSGEGHCEEGSMSIGVRWEMRGYNDGTVEAAVDGEQSSYRECFTEGARRTESRYHGFRWMVRFDSQGTCHRVQYRNLTLILYTEMNVPPKVYYLEAMS